MGEVVATIRDSRGATSVEDWIDAQGTVTTYGLASRYGIPVGRALKNLQRFEMEGRVRRTVASRDATACEWESTYRGKLLTRFRVPHRPLHLQ